MYDSVYVIFPKKCNFDRDEDLMNELNIIKGNLSIVKVEDFKFESQKNKNLIIFQNISFYNERKFSLPLKIYEIYCFELNIIVVPVHFIFLKLNSINLWLSTYIKKILIIILYFVLWFYISLFIHTIYIKYGNQIIKICVYPLISMIVIQYLVIFNLKILITTIILYNWGKYFIINKKISLCSKILLKLGVPILAMRHYSTIILFLIYNKI